MEIILATPRTGSTFICRQLSEQTGKTDYGEIFSISNSANTEESIAKNIQRFSNNLHGIIKVFPNDFKTCQDLFSFDLEKFILSNASGLHVTYRKNYNEQLQSLYVATITQNYQNCWDGIYHVPLDLDFYEKLDQYLQSQLLEQSIIAKNWCKTASQSVKIYALEDYATDAGKLCRPIKWIDEPQLIDFSPSDHFNFGPFE